MHLSSCPKSRTCRTRKHCQHSLHEWTSLLHRAAYHTCKLGHLAPYATVATVSSAGFVSTSTRCRRLLRSVSVAAGITLSVCLVLMPLRGLRERFIHPSPPGCNNSEIIISRQRLSFWRTRSIIVEGLGNLIMVEATLLISSLDSLKRSCSSLMYPGQLGRRRDGLRRCYRLVRESQI